MTPRHDDSDQGNWEMNRSNPNPHEPLRDEILADALREAGRLVDAARREAASAMEAATASAESEREGRLAAAREAADHRRRVLLATAPVEITRLRARRIERELVSLRDAVRDRLAALQGAEYVQTLVALAAEAIAHMEGDAFVLELSADDLRTCGDRLPAAVAARSDRAPAATVTVRQAAGPLGRGVIVRDADGRQMWDNRLEARLERLWPILRHRIAHHWGLDGAGQTAGGPV